MRSSSGIAERAREHQEVAFQKLREELREKLGKKAVKEVVNRYYKERTNATSR